VRLDARNTLTGLVIAGVAGAFLFLPAVFWVGDFLSPSHPVPSATHAPPLLAEAIWARANGGQSDSLKPLEPLGIGRMAACHLLAERFDTREERDRQHDDCMKLLPAIQAVGYLSSVHLRSDGVWQDPRVPFVQFATMARVSNTWTKTQLIDTLAVRGEFTAGIVGVDAAARDFFGRSPDELTLPQAALIGALLGDVRSDPWCSPDRAAARRRQVLQKMRDNQAIDDAAVAAANIAELGLSAPPPSHKRCTE
jgi:hypothetical protein